MSRFGWIARRVVEQSDIVLEILDSRFIDETKNNSVKAKIIIHVINKCDLVKKEVLEKAKKKFKNCVFVSAKEHLGTTILKKKIKELAAKNKLKTVVIGVIGYPNVGKSSVINALGGKGRARTSSEAGCTKGKQYIRLAKNFLLIDTPGVLGKGENLVLIGAKNPNTIKDPDLTVIKLLKMYQGLVEKTYGVEVKEDKEETIEDIAIKLNLKKKGNLPDIERASRRILQDWLKGKINLSKLK